MTARSSWNQRNTRGRRPRLQGICRVQDSAAATWWVSGLRRVRPKQRGNTPFRIASYPCEAQPSQVVGIKGGDVVLLCRRYEFLRLHNLDGIRDTGSKPVTCLT